MRQGLVTKAQENTPIGQSLMKIEIKIFDNGRYEMIEAGIPTKGEVKYGKDRAFLKVMSRFDKDLDIKHTDLILEMPSEGSVFYIDPDADFPQPAELTKSSTTATPEKT
jgi:hypothetical protein